MTSFWAETGSGFGEPGGTPQLRIPRSTPPPPPLGLTAASLSADQYAGT